MAYDIRLVKLIDGEMVIGKFIAEKNALTEVAILQTIPTQQSVQMIILPFGYPFDQDFDGEISMDKVLFTYKACPEDIQTKYLEATSNLTLATGGLAGLDGKGGANVKEFPGLIK